MQANELGKDRMTISRFGGVHNAIDRYEKNGLTLDVC